MDVLKGEVVWNEFMRVCIKLDVTKPLVRGKRIKIGSSESTWVKFIYEKLPDYCYYCGLLSHGHWECEEWIALKEKDEKEKMPYS